MRRLILAALLSVAASGLAIASDPAAKSAEAPPESRAAKRISGSVAYVYGPTIVTALHVRIGMQRASLSVEIGWDVPDPALRSRMQLLRPRLNDAVRTALSEYALNRHRSGAAPDLDQITLLVQQATNATLGSTGARMMLANVVILQR